MEERFNNKLDDFVIQISELIRQNIGQSGLVDQSGASSSHKRSDNPLDSTAKHAISWKAEKVKQHSFGGDKTKRSHSKHLKHAAAQNDKWSRSAVSDAEQRRLAVQNLLPSGRRGSAGSTLFKTPLGSGSTQGDWPPLTTNNTPAAVTWTSPHRDRHFRHRDSSQVRPECSKLFQPDIKCLISRKRLIFLKLLSLLHFYF